MKFDIYVVHADLYSVNPLWMASKDFILLHVLLGNLITFKMSYYFYYQKY